MGGLGSQRRAPVKSKQLETRGNPEILRFRTITETKDSNIENKAK